MTLLVLLLPKIPSQPTPDATVTEFVAAINEKDFAKASSLVAGGGTDRSVFDMFTTGEYESQNITLGINQVSVSDQKAHVKIVCRASEGSGKEWVMPETVDLVFTEKGGWKIVPLRTQKTSVTIGFFSYIITKPEEYKRQRAADALASRTNRRLRNMRQLGLGLRFLIEDLNGTFPKQSINLKKEMMPYIENERPFKDEVTGKDLPFFLNPTLIGMNLSQVKTLSKTPLLAWGKPGSLWFDKDGFTYVSFVDGRAEKFSRAEASKIRWSF